MAKTWGKIGREIAASLFSETLTEAQVKDLAESTIKEITSREPSYESQVKALKQISREILRAYPRRDSEAPNYYYDPSGKSDLSKWRHIIFQDLTLGRNETPSVSEAVEVEKPVETKLEITMQQLDLDTETQDILEAALNHSEMELQDFIKQAIKTYSKTIMGKTKLHSEDLSAVPTDELLNDSKYSTHPGRAAELTKRAIKAIAIYNSEVADENKDRWMITASAIASLTGSRQSTIKDVMTQFQTSIDENNLNPEWELTPYSNRKSGRKIDEIIQISDLMLDGIG